MKSQVCANKQSESYSCLLSDSLVVRGKGKSKRRDNKAAKNRKRKERRNIKDKKRFCNAIETRKQYIKNLSNEQLTYEQITLLSRDLFYFILLASPKIKNKQTNRQTEKVYSYTRDKRKSYQAPASRGFQSICETNATTIYFSRGTGKTNLILST